MKITYFYKELFIDVNSIEEVILYIRTALTDECDRVHLEFDDRVEMWEENWFGGATDLTTIMDNKEINEAAERLRTEAKESVFFSYKTNEGKFDIYFHLQQEKEK